MYPVKKTVLYAGAVFKRLMIDSVTLQSGNVKSFVSLTVLSADRLVDKSRTISA